MAKVQLNSKKESKFREKLTKLFVSKEKLSKVEMAGGAFKQNGTSAIQSNAASKQAQQTTAKPTNPMPLTNGSNQQQQKQKQLSKKVLMKNKKPNVTQQQQQKLQHSKPTHTAGVAVGKAKLLQKGGTIGAGAGAKAVKPTAKPQPNKNKAQQIKKQNKMKSKPIQSKAKVPTIQIPKSESLNGAEKTKIQTENLQQNKSKQINLNSNKKPIRQAQENNKKPNVAAAAVVAKKLNVKRAAAPTATEKKQEPASKKPKTRLGTHETGLGDTDLDSNADSIELMKQVLPGYVPISRGGSESDDPDFTITDVSGDDDNDSFQCSTFDEADDDDDDDEVDSFTTDDSLDTNISVYSDTYSVHDDDIHAPEHRIIHQGTAVKYDIPADEKVMLRNDIEKSHIVECVRKIKKSVIQPTEYSGNSLMKLNEEHAKIALNLKALTLTDVEKNAQETVESDCPELVPMTESDFDDNISEANYVRLNSDDENSIISDINDKYINPCNGYNSCATDSMDEIMDSESDDDEEKDEKFHEFRVDIIDGTKINKVNAMHCLNYAKSSSPMDSSNAADDIKNPIEFECEVMNIPVGITEDATCVSGSSSQESFQSIIERPILTLSWSGDTINQTNTTETNDSKTTNGNSTEDSLNTKADEVDEYKDCPTEEVDVNANIPNELMTTDLPPPKVSKTSNIFINAINCNNVLVLAKESIYVYGTVSAKILHGCVDIYGHETALKQTVEIYSPRGCSLVEITPKACIELKQNDAQLLATALAPYSDTFTHANLRQLQQSYTPGKDALLLLQRNTRAKKVVSNFKKFMTENVFPNINSLKTDRPHYASEYMLQCIVNSESDKALKILPEWKRLTIRADTKMLLAGGKSVGKSTLLRYLVNRNLQKFSRILLIDLDIGQTELFVPQTVSCTVLTQPLLGPGFFLLQQPDKAYMVGHVNVALCAETYMRAVRALLEYCHAREEYADIPWLVNTMGYNKGFGLELLACVADYLRPSDIIQLHSNKNINNFDILLERDALRRIPRIVYKAKEFQISTEQETKCQLHVFHSAVLQESRYQKEWSMSPKDLRYATILARLSMALQGNAEWLTDCTPLSAPLDKVKLLNLLNESDSRNELLGAVETNLVYLCRMEEEQEHAAAPLECYGIGVVRGIDHHLNQIYLLPATVRKRLQYINCLALGEMPLPNSLFANQGPKVQGIAPFVTSTVDANASKAVKQIYYRPTEFQTGVHRDVLA